MYSYDGKLKLAQSKTSHMYPISILGDIKMDFRTGNVCLTFEPAPVLIILVLFSSGRRKKKDQSTLKRKIWYFQTLLGSIGEGDSGGRRNKNRIKKREQLTWNFKYQKSLVMFFLYMCPRMDYTRNNLCLHHKRNI